MRVKNSVLETVKADIWSNAHGIIGRGAETIALTYVGAYIRANIHDNIWINIKRNVWNNVHDTVGYTSFTDSQLRASYEATERI
jgi:hypothetical protein